MSWISLGNVDSRVIRGHPWPDETRFNPWIRICAISPGRGCCLLVTGPGYSGDRTSPLRFSGYLNPGWSRDQQGSYIRTYRKDGHGRPSSVLMIVEVQ